MRERTLRDYTAHWRYFCDWVDDNHPGIKLDEITSSIAWRYYIYMANGRTKVRGHRKARTCWADLVANDRIDPVTNATNDV